MKKGWGYGKNYNILDYNKLNKVFENDNIKVYKANIIYMGYLTITIIHNKGTNNKRVILKYKNEPSRYYDYKNISLKDLLVKIKTKLL